MITLTKGVKIHSILLFAIMFGVLIVSLSSVNAIESMGIESIGIDNTQLRFVNSWGGIVDSVEVSGNTAYVSIGRKLIVFDISNEDDPVEIGSLDMEARTYDIQNLEDGLIMTISGGSANQKSLKVIDVSNPAKPRKVSDWEFFNRWTADFVSIYESENLAYVGEHNQREVYIFNLDDPENPQFMGRFFFFLQNVNDFVIRDNFMYALDETGSRVRLLVYDLTTNITNPALIASVIVAPQGAGYSAGHIALDGNYAIASAQDFSSGQNDKVSIIDLTTFTVVSSITNHEYISDVDFSDGIAYLSGEFDELGRGIVSYDIASNPSNPQLLDFAQRRGLTEHVAVFDNTAFVSDLAEGLSLVDVSTPSELEISGEYYSPANPAQVDKVGNLLYITDQWNGFTVLDISNVAKPSVVGVYYSSDESSFPDNYGIEVVDDKAYLAAGWAGFQVVDISDPENPVLDGLFEDWSDTEITRVVGVEYDDEVVHVGTHNTTGNGWYVNLDVSDSENPTELGSVNLGSAPRSIMTNQNGISHLASHIYTIVNTSDVNNPSLIYRGGPRTTDVALSGNLLYLADEDSNDQGGLTILNVVNPFNFTTVGSYDARASSAVALSGQKAYISGTDNFDSALILLDVSSPFAPKKLSKIYLPGFSSFNTMDIVPLTSSSIVVTSEEIGVQIFAHDGVRKPVSITRR